jgi:hypothetical protein
MDAGYPSTLDARSQASRAHPVSMPLFNFMNNLPRRVDRCQIRSDTVQDKTHQIHKYGNVSQTQGRSAKNLSFLIGDLTFVI